MLKFFIADFLQLMLSHLKSRSFRIYGEIKRLLNFHSLNIRAVHPQDFEIQSPCKQPGKVVGPCRSQRPRYYFDAVTQTCRIFFFGGCEGNDNNFATVAECIERCPVDRVVQQNRINICELPKQVTSQSYTMETKTCFKL